MKLKFQQECYIKKKAVYRGDDGEKYSGFSDEAVRIRATVYSKAGQVAGIQGGLVQEYTKKLLVDEKFSVTNENGVETYWIRNKKASITAGDGVCLYSYKDDEPDYRIVAIYPVGHLKILLEKI